MAYEASGQLEEHEKATTTTPLLFSYTEGELVEKLAPAEQQLILSSDIFGMCVLVSTD